MVSLLPVKPVGKVHATRQSGPYRTTYTCLQTPRPWVVVVVHFGCGGLSEHLSLLISGRKGTPSGPGGMNKVVPDPSSLSHQLVCSRGRKSFTVDSESTMHPGQKSGVSPLGHLYTTKTCPTTTGLVVLVALPPLQRGIYHACWVARWWGGMHHGGWLGGLLGIKPGSHTYETRVVTTGPDNGPATFPVWFFKAFPKKNKHSSYSLFTH